MARTNRRREPDEVVNVNRSMKKKDRRSSSKNIKNETKNSFSAILKAAFCPLSSPSKHIIGFEKNFQIIFLHFRLIKKKLGKQF